MDILDDLTGLYLPERVLVGARRDRVVKKINEAAARYLPHACPIYAYEDDLERRRFDFAELEGTATAVSYEGRHLLLTAEHVLRDQTHAARRLAVVLDGLLEPLPATPLFTSREPDDFAILEFAQKDAARLTNVEFLAIPEPSEMQGQPVARQLTFIGYPCSRNKISYRSNTIPPLEALSVRSTGVTRSQRGSFRARFDLRTAMHADSTRGCPDLHGISGGPVLEHVLVAETVSTRLIGITYEIDGSELVGHDLAYILAGWSLLQQAPKAPAVS